MILICLTQLFYLYFLKKLNSNVTLLTSPERWPDMKLFTEVLPIRRVDNKYMISLTPWTVKYHSQSPHNLLNKIWNKNISRFITSFSSSVKIFWSFLWDVEYVYRLLKNRWDPANKAREDCLMWFDVGEPGHVWAQLCQVSSSSANQRKVWRLRTNQSKPPGLVWEEASISVLHSEKIGRISAVSRAIPRFTWQGLSDFLCWV